MTFNSRNAEMKIDGVHWNLFGYSDFPIHKLQGSVLYCLKALNIWGEIKLGLCYQPNWWGSLGFTTLLDLGFKCTIILLKFRFS